MFLHNVKILNRSGSRNPTLVTIDGTPLHCISIDYHADAESIPVITFRVGALADIEVNNADLKFRFTPETVTDAVKVLRHALQTDKDLRDGFTASIRSAIDDMAWNKVDAVTDPAEYILERLLG